MLKFVFALLVALNALLLAVHLGGFYGEQREPARLNNQLNAGQLRLIAPATARTQLANAARAPKPADIIACTEIGDFPLDEGLRFEKKVEELELGERQSRFNVNSQEISSYIVFIAAQGGPEGPEKKIAELKARGVSNYFVIGDNSPLRGAISLGVFKSEAGAQSLLASLVKQGVHGARVGPRFSSGKRVAFQFRQLDGAAKARLDAIKAAFPDQEMRACK